jgi:uroporphyrinogen-III synthase
VKQALTILSTKKLKTDVLAQARKKGMVVIDEDFIAITYVVGPEIAKELLSIKEHIVFTSQHAVQGLIRNMEVQPISLAGKKIFCLEKETLRATDDLKDIFIAGTAADAAALALTILEKKEVRELSFICGSLRRDELPSKLKEAGVNVQEIEVYRTELKAHLVKEAYAGVLFFSPSGAESFFQANVLTKDLPCFCIGNTTAAAVALHTTNPIIIAGETSQESLLASAEQYFYTNRKLKKA